MKPTEPSFVGFVVDPQALLGSRIAMLDVILRSGFPACEGYTKH